MRRVLYAVLLAVSALALTSCRTDKPPIISIVCIGDGTGGADCVQSDGVKVYKAPSELKNFWMTTQVDEANFAGWCYKVPAPRASVTLERMRLDILARRDEPASEPTPLPEMVLETRGAHAQ